MSNKLATEENEFKKMVEDSYYDHITPKEEIELISKTDNFLEALYIAPELFSPDIIKILKIREDKLSAWRHNSQFCGGIFYLTIYLAIRLRSGKQFYFKNYSYMVFGTLIFSYMFGRIGEWIGNKLYYKKILMKLATIYNVTDEEIEDLHLKINERILKQNLEEQKKVSSLDNVKFKF